MGEASGIGTTVPARAVRLAGFGARAARGLLGTAVGLVYPPTCIACGAATGTPHALCATCWSGLALIERPYCERLGLPFAVDFGAELLSPRAIADPPVFARARAVARYDATARALVQRLKYHDRLDLAGAMGRMMRAAGRELVAEADLIVPVPLHPLRLWRRRFNQAALLAKEVARDGPPWSPSLLARVKRTRPQVGLTRAARAENLQGAFRVPDAAKPRLAGRRVLLIDDVTTTGATANAASRAPSCGEAPARWTCSPSRWWRTRVWGESAWPSPSRGRECGSASTPSRHTRCSRATSAIAGPPSAMSTPAGTSSAVSPAASERPSTLSRPSTQ